MSGKILSAIISSKDLNGGGEDMLNMFAELFIYSIGLRLFFHEVDPTDPGMIINKRDKPASTRKSGRACRTPDVSMNKIKWFGRLIRLDG